MKINTYLEESGLSIKGIWDTIKNGTKIQKGGFLGWILGTVGACMIRAGHEF